MKTDIWFPLVIGDFLKFARNLSPVEKGAWLNITIEMWLQDGWINTSWEGLGRFSGLNTDEWKITCQVFSGLRLGSSQVFREDEGGVTQDWLLDELDKAKKRKNVSKSNGMKGGRPRKEPAGFSAGNLPGNLEHNLQKTSSPSPSHIEERERANKPARLFKERKSAEFTPSAETVCIFEIWKKAFPHDDAPRLQTYKNITMRLKSFDRNQLVFCILKYSSKVKKEILEKPDGKVMTYKGSNFFGEKAYYETYLPSAADLARKDVADKLAAVIASVAVQALSSPGTAGEAVPPDSMENKQTGEK